MKIIRVDNYIITKPIIEIIRDLQAILLYKTGKLRDIRGNEDTEDIVVTCPNDNHDSGHEKNPDCHVNASDSKKDVPYGFYHCFACGDSGPFTKFVARCFSSSEDYAKQWLIKNYGLYTQNTLLIDDDIDVIKTNVVKKLDESVLEQYQHWTPYLGKRKLSREMCENFKVRYDAYNRQVIFPIYDMHNNLKMLAKRSIDTKFFHMDKDVEKEVFALNIIQKNNIKSCIITEGPFDCLTGWTYGVPTIATLGTISDYQIEQINKSCLNVIYTMFDNDVAGKKFTDLIMKKVNKRILVIPISIPNGFKDLNDLDKETFAKLYSDAVKN